MGEGLDSFSFTISLDDSALEGLKATLELLDQTVKQFAAGMVEGFQAATDSAAGAASAGLDKITAKTKEAGTQAKATASEVEQLGQKSGAFLGSLFASLSGGIIGAFSVGSLFSSYKSGVAEVAQMTGAYTGQLDEWRRKRALLARVNKDDIELYRKGRIALSNFNIAMGNLSTTVGRSMAPVARLGIELLEKISNWITAHAGDVTRFLQVVAGVITAVLIPSLKKLAFNPLTPFIVALGAAALAIDDFIVYIRGGDSALSGLWAKFGTGPELAEKIKTAFSAVREYAERLITGIRGLADSVVELWARFSMNERVARVFDTLSDAVVTVAGFIGRLIEGVAELWNAINGGSVVVGAAAVFLDMISVALEGIAAAARIASSAWDYMSGKTGDIVGDMRAIWEAFAGWLSGLWQALSGKIAGFIDGMLSPFKKVYTMVFGTDEGGAAPEPARAVDMAETVEAPRGFAGALADTAETYNAVHAAATAVNRPTQAISQNRNNSYTNSDNRVQNIYVNSTDEAKEVVSAPSFLDFNLSDASAI